MGKLKVWQRTSEEKVKGDWEAGVKLYKTKENLPVPIKDVFLTQTEYANYVLK